MFDQSLLDLKGAYPNARDLEHIIRATAVDITSILREFVFVASARPFPFEGRARFFTLVPVVRRRGVSPHQQLTNTPHRHISTIVIHQSHVIAGNRCARGAVFHITWPVGQEDVQHFCRANAVHNINAPDPFPLATNLCGQGLACGNTGPQRRFRMRALNFPLLDHGRIKRWHTAIDRWLIDRQNI